MKIVGSGAFGDIVATNISGNIYIKKQVHYEPYNNCNCITVESLREITFLSFINHSNVVKPIYNDGKHIYMYDEGVNMHEYSLTRKITNIEFKSIFHQILLGLNYLHSKQIVHGDIKPQNILIKNGITKITDFNLASFDNGNLRGQVYTSEYRPLEVYYSTFNSKSDIWALGCTMWELYFGQQFFSKTKSRAVLIKDMEKRLGPFSLAIIEMLGEDYYNTKVSSCSEMDNTSYNSTDNSSSCESETSNWFRDILHPKSSHIKKSPSFGKIETHDSDLNNIFRVMLLLERDNRPTARDILQSAYFIPSPTRTRSPLPYIANIFSQEVHNTKALPNLGGGIDSDMDTADYEGYVADEPLILLTRETPVSCFKKQFGDDLIFSMAINLLYYLVEHSTCEYNLYYLWVCYCVVSWLFMGNEVDFYNPPTFVDIEVGNIIKEMNFSAAIQDILVKCNYNILGVIYNLLTQQ